MESNQLLQIVEHTFTPTNPLSRRKTTTEIILHCEATPEGKEFTVEQVDKSHKQRGFSCIGYHFCIALDGTIERARPEWAYGAHATGHNATAIGISYVGGMTADMKKAKDTRTDAQKESMYRLVKYLMVKYGLSLDDVHCHYEFANKACPCFKVETFREEFKEWASKNQ